MDNPSSETHRKTGSREGKRETLTALVPDHRHRHTAGNSGKRSIIYKRLFDLLTVQVYGHVFR